MKKIKKDDLFKHIDKFLKDRGIEVRDSAPLGSRLKTGCTILTDTINHAQATIDKARTQMDDRLDKMRSVIHEKTAPRTQTKKAKSAKKSKKSKSAAKKQSSARSKAKSAKKATRPKPATRKVAKKTVKKATAPRKAKRRATKNVRRKQS